jgi:hypothetical protein
MEPVCLGEVERQVMGQDAVPQFGLGARHHLVGLRQFLNVAVPATSGSWKICTAPICSMCRMTWASFGSFLSQLLCSASRVRASATDETSFSSKPADPRAIHQGPVVVARRLEPDRDRLLETPQDVDQAR